MAVRTSSRPESAWCLSSIPVTACHERPLRGKSKSQTFPKTSSGADGRLKIQPLAKHTFRSGNPHVLGFIEKFCQLTEESADKYFVVHKIDTYGVISEKIVSEHSDHARWSGEVPQVEFKRSEFVTVHFKVF